MIGTSELASRLYETWRRQVDIVDPLPYGLTDYLDKTTGKRLRGQSPASQPRPRWGFVRPTERKVWLAVAEEAARLLADAMGAA